MEKGKFLSRKESSIIQGIAVMLMVYHHLFGFPDRIVSEYVIVSDLSFLHIGTILSYFGRICISIFAFAPDMVYTKNFQVFTQIVLLQILKLVMLQFSNKQLSFLQDIGLYVHCLSLWDTLWKSILFN